MDDDWDADDFDPTAQLADKLVTVGLDDKMKKEKEPEKTEATKAGRSGSNAGRSSPPDGELTEAQKLELQKESDADLAMDLFGFKADKQKTWEDLRNPGDFKEHAQLMGEKIASKSSNPNYLLFTNSLTEHMCQPMTKIQLQTIRDTVQQYITAIEKREAEEKKQAPVSAKPNQKGKSGNKKTVNKEKFEDYVSDEFDEYDSTMDREYFR
ncbi:translation initiation factor eIF3 subunit domain-containing protein [Ditylenchus destructor]|uniref:Translation initiation factor eIF3 subunit domain-containing protein n=1 Tax=Ditylenchus destructor TaxID=166010 RepID=A0AAD4N0M1_9BILA|nr:translation initiation factor eIF3 subunit domain-containing protein [Ditylenchus destructor]